jgi:hypothetical protein
VLDIDIYLTALGQGGQFIETCGGTKKLKEICLLFGLFIVSA